MLTDEQSSEFSGIPTCLPANDQNHHGDLNVEDIAEAARSSLDTLGDEVARALQQCEAELQRCVLSCKARLEVGDMKGNPSSMPNSKGGEPACHPKLLALKAEPSKDMPSKNLDEAVMTGREKRKDELDVDALKSIAMKPWRPPKPKAPENSLNVELNVAMGFYLPDDHGLSPKKTMHQEAYHHAKNGRFITGWSTLCRRIVTSTYFDAVSAIAILMNSIYLCIVVDMAAQEDPTVPAGTQPKSFEMLARVFTVWFATEVVLRISADGLRFFYSDDWTWNIFDVLVVGSDVAETLIEAFAGGSQEALSSFIALRVLRVLRITRAIRVVRLVRWFRELRMMVYSILRSGTCLVWSLVMLYLIIFIFGIFFVQNVTDYRKDEAQNGQKKDEEQAFLMQKLKDMFGSITLSHYTLFQAISGGLSWGEVSDRLIRIHWTNGLIMCFFVFFTVFSVMNIITGIFVDTATRAAHADREEVIQGQLETEDATLWQLRAILSESDTDESGTISATEFEAYLQDPRIKAHLQALGLEINEARGLFTLLDMDRTGEVVIDEFATGCMRLKGNAKTLDMAMLMYENKRMFGKLMAFFEYTNTHFSELKSFEKKVEFTLERLNLLLWATRSSQRLPASGQQLAGGCSGSECLPLNEVTPGLLETGCSI